MTHLKALILADQVFSKKKKGCFTKDICTNYNEVVLLPPAGAVGTGKRYLSG